MAAYWLAASPAGVPGVIWQDPDIVIDPVDMYEMNLAVKLVPTAVWVAPHRLYPASTGRDTWVWGHGACLNGMPIMGQEPAPDPAWFAMGYTYTPRQLLDLAAADMLTWEYGQVDVGLSRLTRENAIPAGIVPACTPKHLHFYPRAGDLSWHAPSPAHPSPAGP